MKEKKLPSSQTTMLSSQTKRQKKNIEYLAYKVHVSAASVQLARQLSEDAGLWGLHLERYHNRLSPNSWWLHTDLHEIEEYSDAPSIEDYGIGGYGNHDPRVDEYVKARAKWMLPQLERDLKSFLIEKRNQEAKGKTW